MRTSEHLGVLLVGSLCAALLGCGETNTTAPPAQRPVPNHETPTEWTFCSMPYVGEGCSFEGLRQVRYGAGDTWVVRTFLNELPSWLCSPTHFGLEAPIEGATCEVSNVVETGTLAPPLPESCAHGDCPSIDLARIPLGEPGLSELRVRDTDELPTPGDGSEGAFRTVCGFSHMSFDDPIVFPGQPGRAHLHIFFGNSGTDAHSTAASLVGSGSSTCLGGIANRSAYWVPAMIDTRTGRPLVPVSQLWYYKIGFGGVVPTDVQPMPSGLRIVAGKASATTAQDVAYWGCRDDASATRHASIPDCPVDDDVELHVQFPQCWDGTNLDSPDHASHMAYPTGTGCPASHPVAIPAITLNIHYRVREAHAPTHWRLSSDRLSLPAGHSAHADWFDGWNPAIRDAWVEHCDRAAVDCHAHLLGDGRELY